MVIIYFGIIAAMAVAFFFVFRFLFLWYWKIDEHIKNQQQIIDLLIKINQRIHEKDFNSGDAGSVDRVPEC